MANPVVHFEIMVREGGDLEGVRLSSVEARGGRAVMQPTDVPGQPVSIAMFADPAENLIGLVKNRG